MSRTVTGSGAAVVISQTPPSLPCWCEWSDQRRRCVMGTCQRLRKSQPLVLLPHLSPLAGVLFYLPFAIWMHLSEYSRAPCRKCCERWRAGWESFRERGPHRLVWEAHPSVDSAECLLCTRWQGCQRDQRLSCYNQVWLDRSGVREGLPLWLMRKLPTGDVSLGCYTTRWASAFQAFLAAILVQLGSPPTFCGEPTRLVLVDVAE